MTHAELCALAVRWLKRPNGAGGHGCTVAVSECQAADNGEIPDAIGFRAAGYRSGTVVVECKTSRSDFFADRLKPHRALGAGMGNWRYFMAPEGVLKVSDLPERWGLLSVNSRGHINPLAGPAVHAKQWGQFDAALSAYRQTADVERELSLSVKLLARLGDAEAMNLRIREAFNSQARMAKEVDRLRAQLRERVQASWATT